MEHDLSAEEIRLALESFGVKGMAEVARETLSGLPNVSAEQLFRALIARELSWRESEKNKKRLREAQLHTVSGRLDEIVCEASRGLDRARLSELSKLEWVRDAENLLVWGGAGCGKSFLAAALARASLDQGAKVLFARTPRLVRDLAAARAGGAYQRALAKLAKLDLLVLDDFALAPLELRETRDLLEVVEDRHGRAATLVASPCSPRQWADRMADPLMAAALTERLIARGIELALKGPSLRPKKKDASAAQRQLFLPAL